MEIRKLVDIELRAKDEESRIVEGIPIVFNQKTDMGWFTEEIDAHALDECDMSDVVLTKNHDFNQVLAGTRNNTLSLEVREDDVFQSATIIDTSLGNDTLKEVKSGLITKMSFAFTIDENGGEEWISGKEKDHRIIRKIDKLFDVSLVTFPAYPTTEAWARSKDESADKHRALIERRNAQTKKMEEILNGNLIKRNGDFQD